MLSSATTATFEAHTQNGFAKISHQLQKTNQRPDLVRSLSPTPLTYFKSTLDAAWNSLGTQHTCPFHGKRSAEVTVIDLSVISASVAFTTQESLVQTWMALSGTMYETQGQIGANQ